MDSWAVLRDPIGAASGIIPVDPPDALPAGDVAGSSDDGVPEVGSCHARGVNAGLPPVWMIYLPVGDLGESLRLVEEDGGTVVEAHRRADGRHGYAAVRDPSGCASPSCQHRSDVKEP